MFIFIYKLRLNEFWQVYILKRIVGYYRFVNFKNNGLYWSCMQPELAVLELKTILPIVQCIK